MTQKTLTGDNVIVDEPRIRPTPWKEARKVWKKKPWDILEPSDMRKAFKLSLSGNRLDDPREQIPVEWLLKDNERNLNLIKGAILYFDRSYHASYQHLSPEKQKESLELLDNQELVDRVIVTIFQWFATGVGKCDMEALMKKIREYKYPEGYEDWYMDREIRHEPGEPIVA